VAKGAGACDQSFSFEIPGGTKTRGGAVDHLLLMCSFGTIEDLRECSTDSAESNDRFDVSAARMGSNQVVRVQ
jgi:hypothetical protein